ncbi:FliH/SctL family protein [Alicycliphilus denitrificans]|uniref:FliH/SctL family protein n=1 Tax=Alicycliphilus denitrificans TaxID=179636 RepID=UPI00384F80DF
MPSSNRYYTRFIPREEVGDVMRWEFGDVHDAGTLRPLVERQPQIPEPVPPPALDEGEQQALLQQAHAQGHAEGYESGLAEGQEQAQLAAQQQFEDYVAGQGRAAAERLAQVAQSLEQSLTGLQQTMAQEVLQLACDIARQVVRREVQGNPQAMLPVVREALGMLAAESRPATVRLHPADWAALEKPLREEFSSTRIEWQADAAVQPGDCLVESAGMVIDGTLDKRWRRAIAALGLTAAWREDAHAD